MPKLHLHMSLEPSLSTGTDLKTVNSKYFQNFPKMSISLHCCDSSTIFNVLMFLLL